ncbi:MAG TPA: MarR family transcriptional regulator, partial [Candidatus Polarisedimenticolia bacterium]|nr:MarR family transcriptional regulator [Candidatus Polarisedimenticolia bacterium]
MCLSVSALTRVVDQLEKKAYATRRRLPADRRVIFAELTPAGKAILKRMETMIRHSEREVLSEMAPADREGLLRGLRHLNAALQARASRPASCAPGRKVAGAK